MSEDDEHELVREAADLLTESASMVAVAESSTGGLVSSKLTNISGSSAYFERGAVTYSNQAKIDLLAVDPDTLDSEGAVSAPVARQMASGIRENAGTTWGVSTTGIAGPTGGTAKKPVGTIFIGTAYSEDGEDAASANRYQFDGSRLECKERFARQAIADLIDMVESKS